MFSIAVIDVGSKMQFMMTVQLQDERDTHCKVC